MEKPETNINATFEELELLTTDPYVDRIYAKAREYEEMINTFSDITQEERVAVINELDAIWPFLQNDMAVSGRVSFMNTDRESEPRYYEDEVMRSNGFALVDDGEIYVDGEAIRQYKITHYFTLYSDEEKTQLTYGVGRLDEVAIDYPRYSAEKIENGLRYFHPEIMEEVDSIILNCNNEEDAVLGLKDFNIEAIPSKIEDQQLATDLQNYINNALEFDHAIPYMTAFSGECYVNNEAGVPVPVKLKKTINTLVAMGVVRFLPKDPSIHADEKQTLIPCIESLMYNPDKRTEPVCINIPTSSFIQLESVRRQVYED